MSGAEVFNPGLTMGEARVLIGQLAGMAAEDIGGWAIIFQTVDEEAIGILSSAMSNRGILRGQVLYMLTDAARQLSNELREP